MVLLICGWIKKIPCNTFEPGLCSFCRGISDEALAMSDLHCSIPMKGMVDSFNVSVAAGILMHHAVCDRISRTVMILISYFLWYIRTEKSNTLQFYTYWKKQVLIFLLL